MSATENKTWLQHYPEWTPHSLDYGDTTLLDVYDNNLAINGHKSALSFFGRSQSYADLDRQVRRAAMRLEGFRRTPGRPRSNGSAELPAARRRLLCRAQAGRIGS